MTNKTKGNNSSIDCLNVLVTVFRTSKQAVQSDVVVLEMKKTNTSRLIRDVVVVPDMGTSRSCRAGSIRVWPAQTKATTKTVPSITQPRCSS